MAKQNLHWEFSNYRDQIELLNRSLTKEGIYT